MGEVEGMEWMCGLGREGRGGDRRVGYTVSSDEQRFLLTMGKWETCKL